MSDLTYKLPFFRGKLGPWTYSFRDPAQILGALGCWAPVSLFPCWIWGYSISIKPLNTFKHVKTAKNESYTEIMK